MENESRVAARVLVGDCLASLRKEPDNSADSLVTDPPAGISFLGKAWDSNLGDWKRWESWLAEVLTEARRVLKPGAHGLVWALPRTSHHTANAIEAAGFEIRHVVTHLYGQGFPKNHNLSKALDKMKDDRAEILRVTAWIREARDAAGITNAQIDEAFVFNGMAGHWTSNKSQPSIPTVEQVPKLLEVLGTEPPEEIAALLWTLNDAKGKPGENWYRRESLGTVEISPFGESPAQEDGHFGFKDEYEDTAPATDAAKRAEGIGSALKPAAEFWYLIRAPLDGGTIARNFLEWGTGGINLGEGLTEIINGRHPPDVVLSHAEGCTKIGEVEDSGYVINRFDSGAKPFGGAAGESFESTSAGGGTRTAWACVEGCPVRELDAQSGYTKTGRVASHSDAGMWGSGADVDYADRESGGGASRFFPCFAYVKKPSVREKSAGLSGANKHPTAKPLTLCAWFVRLVTPPGADRVVLDPFAGSGTTGVAAVREGRSFLGCELDPEHAERTRARIEHALAGFAVDVRGEDGAAVERPESAEKSGQLSIFESMRKGGG